MTETETNTPKTPEAFEVDGTVAQVADIPMHSLVVMAGRTFSHILRNEVASAVKAWRESEAKAGRELAEDEIATYAKQKREEKLEKILNGTLGVRAAGAPRVSGIDAVMRQIAVEWLKAELAKRRGSDGKPLTLPTGDKTINVAGKDMDREALIEATLRKRQADIRSKAEQRMRENEESETRLEELV